MKISKLIVIGMFAFSLVNCGGKSKEEEACDHIVELCKDEAGFKATCDEESDTKDTEEAKLTDAQQKAQDEFLDCNINAKACADIGACAAQLVTGDLGK